MSYQVIMPLFNFQSTVERIKLGNDLLISPISPEKVKRIQPCDVTIINEFEMEMLSYALETQIRAHASEVNRVNDLFEKVILGLRLFKSGDVHQKVIFFKTKKGLEHSGKPKRFPLCR